MICTNRQLAEIAHRRLTSLSKLATVEGLGKAKIERYGTALVQIVTSDTPIPEDDVSNMNVPDKVSKADEPAREE